MSMVTSRQVGLYWDLFVNGSDYCRQATTANASGKFGYYLARNRLSFQPLSLTRREIRAHLEGGMTLGLYNLSPASTTKWLAVDGDYPGSLDHLRLLQQRLSRDGAASLIEESRRGGHLWIFASEPVEALPARIYLHTRAADLGLPVKTLRRPDGTFPMDGLELYPKQSRLKEKEYGCSLRGPLGVHRATQLRYWFVDAEPNLKDQLELLARTPRLTPEALAGLIENDPVPAELRPPPAAGPYILRPSGEIFRITDVLPISARTKRSSGNYVLRCPSCAAQGRDRTGDNLHIKISEPLKYQCRSGCSANQIRAALGRPRRSEREVRSLPSRILS